MQSLTLSACVAILIVAACLPIGVAFRRSIDGPGNDSVEAIDLPLGYSIASIILVLSLRVGLGMAGGSLIVALTLIYALTKIVRPIIRFNRIDCVAASMIISFAAAIISAYFPLLWDYGTVFHSPEIFDAPKHILTITALQGATSWPPQNPFMPGLGFSYNFGFYIIPSTLVFLAGNARIGISILPWLAAISAASAFGLTLSIAKKLSTPRSLMPIVAISATWLGGATPLFVDAYPALGFRMHAEGLVAGKIWADEPFVSAIFVPQHLFAATCVLSTIYMAMCSGAIWRRAMIAATISLAGSLSSLILLPHISLIFAAAVAVMLLRSHSRPDSLKSLLISFAYGAILLPFVIEAAKWQSGAGESILGLPQDLKTMMFVLLAIGPSAILAGAAIFYGFRRGNSSDFTYLILAIIVALSGAMLLQYSEAPFKSTLLLRTILPALAGVGFGVIWRALEFSWARAIFLLALCFCVIINIPTMWFFAAAPLRNFSASERNFLQALQRARAPIMFDGTSDQWLAALAAKQTISDFRANRTDAYLPPEDRRSYARFFDSGDRSIVDMSSLGAIIYPAGKTYSLVPAACWKAPIDAMGLRLAEKEC